MKHFIALLSLLFAVQAWGSSPKDSSAVSNSGVVNDTIVTSENINTANAKTAASADSMDNSISSYDAWALSIPGSTSAPAVALECMEHTAGWSIGPLFSRSGKTRYNANCIAFAQCLAVVQTYAYLGANDDALKLLHTCIGGNNDTESNGVHDQTVQD